MQEQWQHISKDGLELIAYASPSAGVTRSGFMREELVAWRKAQS